jgi:hypothetical protein
MVRSYAIVLGPAMVRLVYVAISGLFRTPERSLIVLSFWAGWLITCGAAELWITARRRRGTS